MGAIILAAVEPWAHWCCPLPINRNILFLSAIAALSGCAGDQSLPVGQAPRAGPDAVMRNLVNTENGLELRKWLVADDSQIVGAALLRYADGPWLDDEQDQRLKRNGFRFLRVPLESLDQLLADLGGTTLTLSGWHGQVLDWRQIESAPVGLNQQTVAIDGRARRFQRGQFRLIARCWTMPMEDGPVMQLNLNVAFRRAGAGSFRTLLNDRRPLEDFLPSLELEISLEAGYAYLLTCESPAVDWSEIADSPGDSDEAADLPGSPPSEPPRAGRIGPDPGSGPDGAGPPPIGRFMLMQRQEPHRRGILLFVPRISDSLYPPGSRHQPPPPEVNPPQASTLS